MGKTMKLGHFGLIKPEVDLIGTILRTSSRLRGNWILVDAGECDALLVYNAEKSFSPFVIKPTTQLIMIKRRGEAFSGYAFFKPFRADELIDTLILIESNLANSVAAVTASEPTGSQTLYRLNKWPSAELLLQQKHYMMLALYLSRGSKTISDLVTLSGHSEKFCSTFVDALKKDNLLTIEENKFAHPPMPVPPEQVETKKTFFSMLRSRLGISKGQ